MCPSGKVMCAVALIYTECDGDFFGAVSLPSARLWFMRPVKKETNTSSVGMHPQCACACVTFRWMKVLLIESLGQDHSAINTHISVIAAPSKTSRSVKKRDFAQGCVECVQKSMLFNRHLTIASIWRQRSNKQEKKGSLLPSALPARTNIYANSHANPDFFQSDVRARVHVHTCVTPLQAVSHGFSAVFFLSLVSSLSESGQVHSSVPANL